MANHNGTTAPWTIKAVPVEVREKAVRYAKMDDLTVAEWLTRAVEGEANRQDGNAVLAPAKPEPTMESALAAIDRGFKLAAVVQSLAAAATAGLPVGKSAARDAVRVMRTQVREAGGLPALKGRKTNGQTAARIGQTISDSQEGSGNGVEAG